MLPFLTSAFRNVHWNRGLTGWPPVSAPWAMVQMSTKCFPSLSEPNSLPRCFLKEHYILGPAQTVIQGRAFKSIFYTFLG